MRLWMLIFITILISCSEKPMMNQVTSIHPEVRKVDITRISEMGRIARVVKLEATDASLLGNIEKVKVDPRNKDLLVADLKASKGIYRFDPQGKYLCKYGRSGQGPGEYDSILDFTVLKDGTVVLLSTFKLIAFDPLGTLIREKRLQITGLRVNQLGDQLVVYGLKPRGPSHMIWAFDQKLNEVGHLHPEDTHFRQLMFMPQEIMASNGDQLFVAEPFQAAFTVYDSGFERGRKYILPSEADDAALARAWTRFDSRKDETAQEIAAQVHRIENLHVFNGLLHFTEFGMKGEILRNSIFDPNLQRIYRYGPARLLMPGSASPDLGMDAIVGSYAKGIIGVAYDPENFARYKKQDDALRHISFEDTDNPLLLFFQYHMPATEQVKEEVSP